MKRNGDRDRMERQGSGAHRPLPIAVPDQRLRSRIADGGSARIEFLAEPTAGELRIGCPEAIAAGPVLAVVNRLTRRHPRMAFQVATGVASAIYRGLMEP